MAKDLAQIFIRATDQTKGAFDSLKKNTQDAGDALGRVNGLLAGLGVGISAGAFAYLLKNSIDATAALDDLADTTALTVETLSSLQQTAKIGGHSFEMVTGTATKFAKSVAEAAGGNKELLRSFDALGISQQRLRTAKFDDLYTEFAAKIANAENKTYAIAHATDLAGKSAAQALPFFKDLAETGLEQARVTQQQAEAAERLQKQIGHMSNAFDGIVQKMASAAVPVMTEWLEKVNSAYTATGNLASALQGLANLGQFGKTAAEQIATIDKELEKVEKRRGMFDGGFGKDTWRAAQGMRESGLLNARGIAVANLARENPSWSGGLDGAAGDAPFKLGAPKAPAGPADTAGPQLIAQLTNQLAELNGESSEVDKVIRKLTDGTKTYTLEVQAEAIAIAGDIDEKKRLRKETDEAVAAYDRAMKAQEAGAKVLAEFNKTQVETLSNLEFETKLLAMNETERETAIALRKLENEYTQASIKLVDEENDAYARRMETLRQVRDIQRAALPGAVAANQAAKEAVEANKKMVEDAKRQYEQLTESLTDALLRGFEAGKGFAENFKATLKNMFSTLVLRPIIQPLVQGMAGGINGVLGTGGVGGVGGGSGLLQNASSLFNLGNGASFAGGYAATAGLGAAEAAAMIEAGTAGFAGAGMEAGALGMSAAGAGGTALSAALPYVGLAIAAYSLMKGSKGGPASFTGLDVSGTAGMQGLTSSNWLAHSQNSKQGFSWQSFDHGATGGINQLVQGAFADMGKLADSLGLDKSRLSGANASFGFSVTEAGTGAGPTTQEVINAFGRNLGQLTDQLAYQLMPNLKSFAQANESATQTLVRLVQVQEQLRMAEQQGRDQLAGAVRGLPGALGITGLEGARNALATSEYVSPMARLSAARSQLDSTYQSAMGGDLTSVNAFPQMLQQALSIGRDVGASGPAFQSLFTEGNKQLNELLAKQQSVQQDILKNIDLSILESSRDQIAELKRGFKMMEDWYNTIVGELRRIREAA